MLYLIGEIKEKAEECLDTGEIFEFSYMGQNDDDYNDRSIYVETIYERNEHIYIKGFDLDKSEDRTFRIDRIGWSEGESEYDKEEKIKVIDKFSLLKRILFNKTFSEKERKIEQKSESKFYQSKWFVVLSYIFFWPLGIFLGLKFKIFNKKIHFGMLGVMAAFLLLTLID